MVHGPSDGLVKPEEEEAWVESNKRTKDALDYYLKEPNYDHFRDEPIGTTDGLDYYLKELNYDQVSNELKQTYFVDKTRGMFDNQSLPPAFTSESKSGITRGFTNLQDQWSSTNLRTKKTWVASPDAGGNNNPLKQCKKRKIDPGPISSVTRMVTVKTTFNEDVIVFHFPISLGLSNLEYKVAQGFKIKSNRLRLKYLDKENDLILIACDVDLNLAVDTTAINNSINLICLSDVGPPTGVEPDVIQPSLESMADNFMFVEYSSDAESLVATGKKRKIEWDTIPSVTGIVTAKITYNKYMKIFEFFISSGITNLENKVARSFKLKGKRVRLKYWDEDEDLILIACDVDLKLAVFTTGSNNSINLICLSD